MGHKKISTIFIILFHRVSKSGFTDRARPATTGDFFNRYRDVLHGRKIYNEVFASFVFSTLKRTRVVERAQTVTSYLD